MDPTTIYEAGRLTLVRMVHVLHAYGGPAASLLTLVILAWILYVERRE